jgi:hypothetical protein
MPVRVTKATPLPPPPRVAMSDKRPAKLPTGFKDFPLTAELEQGIRDLRPGSYDMLDFKMGVLSRLDECLGDGLNLKGKIEVGIQYDNPDEKYRAEAVSVDIEDSTLPETMDEIVMSCLQSALLGHRRQFIPGRHGFPGSGGFGIVFPLEQDSAYYFARNGKFPFKLHP